MKKSVLCKGLLFSACFFSFFSSPLLWAQVTDPSTWKQFVDGSENPLVTDTFRLQTFGDSERDNWSYTIEGNAKVEKLPEIYTDPFGGRMGIRMFTGSIIRFQPFDPRFYKDVQGELCYEGNDLKRNDTLNVRVYRQTGIAEPIVSKPRSDNDFCRRNQLSISKTPYNIDVFMAKNSNSTKGFYLLEYALIYGKIPQYSLFSGKGGWEDTAKWSHLPPLRHRNALIDGQATLSDSIYCNSLSLKKGSSIRIAPKATLSVKQLTLHGTETALFSEGKIAIKEEVTLHKTFESKGKWYFISFPFDVYPSGIDARFSQQDATPNNGGNFFYVLTYNGEKRATSNRASGNWEVLPIRTDNTPVFEKNKGYLIALDEKASDRTITFSSQKGTIPKDFRKEALISVSFQTAITPGTDDNQGWQLCGNPLPAPVTLSQITPNPDLDGYIYVYNGNGYSAYPIGSSSKTLPPFSAFFVKTKRETTIRIVNGGKPASTEQIKIPTFALKSNEEPIVSLPTENETVTSIQPEIRASGGVLFIENMPEHAVISIYDIAGKSIIRQVVGGKKQIPFAVKKGVYILQIEAAGYYRTFKFQNK